MVKWEETIRVDVGSVSVVLEGRTDYGGAYGPPVSPPEWRVAVVVGKRRRLAATVRALATELQMADALPVLVENAANARAFAAILCELGGLGEPLRKPSLSCLWGDRFGIDVAKEQVQVDDGVMRFAAVDTGFDRTPRGFRVVVNLATLDMDVEELEPIVE